MVLRVFVVKLRLLLFFFFLVGAAAGSFLNVVAGRYSEGNRLFSREIFIGRSRCPHCGERLRWHNLIPILSFLIQQGRCLYCGRRFSFQYLIVEVAAGTIFAALLLYFHRFFNIADLVAQNFNLAPYYIFLTVWVFAAGALFLMSLIDFRLRIIPDQINIFLTVLGLFAAVLKYFYLALNRGFLGEYSGWFDLSNNVFANHLSAGIIGLGLFGLIVFLSRGRGMGLGDVKLAGALGLLLGWPDAVFAFFMSFIIGAAIAVLLITFRKKSLKDAVPFGPFLALGTVVTVFFGKEILDFYFRLFIF